MVDKEDKEQRNKANEKTTRIEGKRRDEIAEMSIRRHKRCNEQRKKRILFAG